MEADPAPAMEEDEEVAPGTEEEQWNVENSIFADRCKEADSNSYLDTPEVVAKMFELDWSRMCRKDNFMRLLGSEAQNVRAITPGWGLWLWKR